MEKLFKLHERKTTVRTEILAGVTTFFAMAYIILVNPGMIGFDFTANGFEGEMVMPVYNSVLFATCLSAAIGCFLMAFLANFPFAQAPGMGLNAFFTFTVMPAMATLAGTDLPWDKKYQMALALVFISGILFLIITFVGAREAIIKGIPSNIKLAISGGIGLFIAYIGLQNSGLVVANASTQVALIDFTQWADNGPAIHGALLALFGLLAIGVLYSLKVKGSILIGILATTLLAYLTGYSTLPEGGFQFNLGQQAGDFVSTGLFKMDFAGLFSGGEGIAATIGTIIILVLSFSMVDMFDTIGTFLGAAQSAGLMNEEGEMQDMKKGLMCDAIATTAGAALGTSTVTTFVESSAGIGEGGRTGLTALTTGILFIVALLLSPFVVLIPGVATAPALIFVGCLMIGGLRKVNFTDPTEGLPAFLTVAMMPLSYSIANGIAFGLISYCVLKACTGKIKDIKIPTVIVAVLFIIRFFVSI